MVKKKRVKICTIRKKYKNQTKKINEKKQFRTKGGQKNCRVNSTRNNNKIRKCKYKERLYIYQ